MEQFSSPEQLIQAAQAAKQGKRLAIESSLKSVLDDPHAFSVPPSLVADIESLAQRYGDAALKAVGMWALGTWHVVHSDMLEQHVVHGNHESALWLMNDMAKIGLCLQALADIGTIGGDEQWKEMLKQEVGQAVLEHLEEHGLALEQIIQPASSHEQP